MTDLQFFPVCFCISHPPPPLYILSAIKDEFFSSVPVMIFSTVLQENNICRKDELHKKRIHSYFSNCISIVFSCVCFFVFLRSKKSVWMFQNKKKKCKTYKRQSCKKTFFVRYLDFQKSQHGCGRRAPAPCPLFWCPSVQVSQCPGVPVSWYPRIGEKSILLSGNLYEA